MSWEEAVAYGQWLSEMTGKRYRLPTEAEWEYLARAGSDTKYWWGDEVGQNRANCDGCESQWNNKQTAPVGSFRANAFGVHDTAGNVLEWVQDCWHKSYTGAPSDGSAWEEADDHPEYADGGDCGWGVVRGGSWAFFRTYLESAVRFRIPRKERYSYLGFRLAQDARSHPSNRLRVRIEAA
ncbi:MAG: formylglycine-generating enzyme family protein [Gammaproteobacteria bacterium]|nr:formylglycine-generating enzyme family protein [Gammaproteobacteria bacterium]MDH3411515.1 formylglycine-generating enzyme family protein [Gammaproteobacteria bacterium]